MKVSKFTSDVGVLLSPQNSTDKRDLLDQKFLQKALSNKFINEHLSLSIIFRLWNLIAWLIALRRNYDSIPGFV